MIKAVTKHLVQIATVVDAVHEKLLAPSVWC